MPRKPKPPIVPNKQQRCKQNLGIVQSLFEQNLKFLESQNTEDPGRQDLRLHIALQNQVLRLMDKREKFADNLENIEEETETKAGDETETETELVKKNPHWKTNPVAFAREALNVELFDHQRRLCISTTRITLLVAGRGAGKSVAARVKAIYDAVIHSKHRVLVVSSGQRMSSNFGEELLDLLSTSPINSFVKTMNKLEVVFNNGSVLNFLPANADTIRGYHPKIHQHQSGLTVVLDEACFMENGDEIRKAFEYTLITTERDLGKLFVVTSPSTMSSWVYQYAQQAEDPKSDVTMIQCGSSANPFITDEEIERLKTGKNELEYRAEVLGEWVDGAFGLFSGLIEPNIIKTENHPLPENTVFSLGADLALSCTNAHDRNALALLAKFWPPGCEEPHYRLQEVHILDHASDQEIQTVVKHILDKQVFYTAAIEQYQGKALAEYCQRLRIETQLVAPTPGNQQMIFHEMHRLLRMGLLQLPDSLPELFFDELKNFEYRRDANGKASFGHPPSGKFHDDSVYALAWAIYAAQEIPLPPCVYEKYDRPLMMFIPKY